MKPILSVLNGEKTSHPPIWFMRQAGRYLPEYRALREKAGDFMTMCFTPDYAAEITLQPIRRFHYDAAILFSDILVIPYALGQSLRFEEGAGPILEPCLDYSDRQLHEKLSPVYETIRRVKKELPENVTLIGFAGAPWTVMTYMIEGGTDKTRNYAKTYALLKTDETYFLEIQQQVVSATAEYLIQQIENGVEVIQIFDSWAGAVKPEYREKLIYQPTRKIIETVRKKFPQIPIIGFPRGIGDDAEIYVQKTGVTALGIDENFSLERAKKIGIPIQGNLNPELLANDLPAALAQTEEILSALHDHPYIFNLGHGILPHTPLHHVEAILKRVRGK